MKIQSDDLKRLAVMIEESYSQPLTRERVKDYKRLEYMLSRAYHGAISPSADLEIDKELVIDSLPDFLMLSR